MKLAALVVETKKDPFDYDIPMRDTAARLEHAKMELEGLNHMRQRRVNYMISQRGTTLKGLTDRVFLSYNLAKAVKGCIRVIEYTNVIAPVGQRKNSGSLYLAVTETNEDYIHKISAVISKILKIEAEIEETRHRIARLTLRLDKKKAAGKA